MNVEMYNTIVTIGVILFGLYFLYLKYYKVVKDWQRFADANGLVVERPNPLMRPTIVGSFQGYPFRLYAYVVNRSSGENTSSSTYTAVEISLPSPVPDRLELTHQGIGTYIGKLIDRQDILLDDMEFDPKYVIRSTDESLPKSVLRGATKKKLLTLKKWAFEWDGEKAIGHRSGIEYDGETLRKIAEILSEVATQLEEIRTRS
jgi:hypothetical protein